MKKLFALVAALALAACSGMGSNRMGDTSGSGDSGRSGASSTMGQQNQSGAPVTNSR